MLGRRRVAQRDVVEDQGEGDEEDEQREAPGGPVPPVERQGPGACRGARHENDVQLSPPCSRRARPTGRRPNAHGAISATAAAHPRRRPDARRLGRPAAAPSRTDGTVRRHLPRALAERIRVADDQGPELVLAADAGAIAGIARQRAPDLLADLRREGYEFTAIRVRVQVGGASMETNKSIANQIDTSGIKTLAALAGTLPAGPLKASLARLLRQAR